MSAIKSPRIRQQVRGLIKMGWTDQQILDRYNILAEPDDSGKGYLIRLEGIRELRAEMKPRDPNHLLSSPRFSGTMARTVNQFLYT